MRLLIIFSLFFLFSCSTNSAKQSATSIISLLSEQGSDRYSAGYGVVLFSYSNNIETTEAYADWASYLNDFKESNEGRWHFERVQQNDLGGINLDNTPHLNSLSEFTVFLKKGKPVYIYSDLIVEPQVYISVKHAYDGVSLSDEDKAFLPSIM